MFLKFPRFQVSINLKFSRSCRDARLGMGVTLGGIRAGIGSLRVFYMNQIMKFHDQSA